MCGLQEWSYFWLPISKDTPQSNLPTLAAIGRLLQPSSYPCFYVITTARSPRLCSYICPFGCTLLSATQLQWPIIDNRVKIGCLSGLWRRRFAFCDCAAALMVRPQLGKLSINRSQIERDCPHWLQALYVSVSI